MSLRRVSVTEFEDGTTEVEFYPERVAYTFDSWDEAFEELPNLDPGA